MLLIFHRCKVIFLNFLSYIKTLVILNYLFISLPFLVLSIHLVVSFLLLVLTHRAGFPQGVFGYGIPIDECHSQPQCG